MSRVDERVRIARPVDWSSMTMTVLRAEGSTLTCALAMTPLGNDTAQRAYPPYPWVSSKKDLVFTVYLQGVGARARKQAPL